MGNDLLSIEMIVDSYLERNAKTKSDLEKFAPILHDAVESAIADFIEARLSIDPDSDVGDYDPVW